MTGPQAFLSPNLGSLHPRHGRTTSLCFSDNCSWLPLGSHPTLPSYVMVGRSACPLPWGTGQSGLLWQLSLLLLLRCYGHGHQYSFRFRFSRTSDVFGLSHKFYSMYCLPQLYFLWDIYFLAHKDRTSAFKLPMITTARTLTEWSYVAPRHPFPILPIYSILSYIYAFLTLARLEVNPIFNRLKMLRCN